MPGSHGDGKWGLGRVADVLREHREEYGADYHGFDRDTIVLQVSSIGDVGVTDNWLGPKLVAALDGTFPLGTRRVKHPSYEIVWPTRREVQQCGMGRFLRMSLATERQRKKYTYMKPRMNQWRAGQRDLDGVMPHVKTYARFAADGSVRWVLLTSANVSKAAWGAVPASKPARVTIQSWELGVMLFPQSKGLTRFMAKDTVIPYDWPLMRYCVGDEPWCS